MYRRHECEDLDEGEGDRMAVKICICSPSSSKIHDLTIGQKKSSLFSTSARLVSETSSECKKIPSGLKPSK